MNLLRGIILFTLLGCTSGTGPIPIEYTFSDYPNERRIELGFANESEDFLCLLPGCWPNQAGKIHFASEYVFLIVNDQRFPIVDFNTGYCQGRDGCATRVAPGEVVFASISYRDFSIPENLIEMPKTLEFSTVAVKCRSK